MTDISARIAENLQAVGARIAAAAHVAGRAAEEVRLVAVTKYAGVAEARALIEAGCLDLGESRPQELWLKADAIADPRVRWHLVGHLQRNKVRRTLPLVSLIHSVDSLRLLATIDEESRTLDRVTPVLLEVNISADLAKHGFRPEEMPGIIAQLPEYPYVKVCGLMGMASLDGDLDSARGDFARLRQLRDPLQTIHPLPELSMGMSGDLEAAIAEGATIVRIGSALFEGIS
jgi:pyridoxal phosphate enzyme (YggS family)